MSGAAACGKKGTTLQCVGCVQAACLWGVHAILACSAPPPRLPASLIMPAKLCSETTSAYRPGLGQDIIAWTREAVEAKRFIVYNDKGWGLGDLHLPESFV